MNFPGSVIARTYEEFVALHLNCEFARASRVLDAADAIRIGTDEAAVPWEWIDLMTDDPVERAAWRQREFRKEL